MTFGRCVDVDQIYFGIVMHQFLQLYNTVMALGYCQNFVSAQYLRSAQYLMNESIEFDHIIHMYWI